MQALHLSARARSALFDVAKYTHAKWHLRRALSAAALPEHKTIYMPKLSPTMEVGTIQEWKKKEGDIIEAGDVIAEIETDKATRSFEYNRDGYLAKVWLSRVYLDYTACILFMLIDQHPICNRILTELQ